MSDHCHSFIKNPPMASFSLESGILQLPVKSCVLWATLLPVYLISCSDLPDHSAELSAVSRTHQALSHLVHSCLYFLTGRLFPEIPVVHSIISFFAFLGPHLQHMEVPRLGVELKVQLLACTTATAMRDPSCTWNLHCSSQQCWILNPLSEARD